MESACLERGVENDADCGLTPGELTLIHNPEDIGLLAKIKGMSARELAEFQIYNVKSFIDYLSEQREWMEVSKYLLGTRLNRPPSEREAMNDYIEKNADRFRVFYGLKYPDRVVK